MNIEIKFISFIIYSCKTQVTSRLQQMNDDKFTLKYCFFLLRLNMDR